MRAFLSVCVLLVITVTANNLDDEWKAMLNNPPAKAVQEYDDLALRAAVLVSRITELKVTGEIDMVCSGGGDYDAYYLGVAMVASRVEAAKKGLVIPRYAGASAGGQAPFEMSLKGENATILARLSYGVLTEENPNHYSSVAVATLLQQHHWRLMASWQTTKYGERYPSLNGIVFLALSCLDPLPKLVKVSNFSDPVKAEHAFLGTGSVYESYDGMPCSDGGAESGKKMTPLFQDGLRPQMIVDLMACHGYSPFRIKSSEYIKGIQKGQDEMAAFLSTGSCDGCAISLCPKGAKVNKNVCASALQAT